MSKALIKDTLRTIRKNLSRYISIMLIIALGTAFFVGIKATAPDMYETADRYFKDYNLMDIRVQSMAGLTNRDVDAIMGLEGVEYASGQKFIDALVRVNGNIEADIDGTQISTRAYSISPENIANFLNGNQDGSYINRPELIEGEYPSSVKECLVDASRLSTPESFKIGNKITLETENGDMPSGLNTNEFEITGIVRSPYYLSFERGNTTVGSGKVGTYIIIPEEAFTNDYYSEIYVNVEGANNFDPYSDEYFDYIAPIKTNIEAISAGQVQMRVASLGPELQQKIVDAQRKIDNSSSEVSEALKDLDEKIEMLEELVATGKDTLAKAQQEFNDKFSDAEGTLATNTEEYKAAIAEYQEKNQQLLDSKKKYNENKILLDRAQSEFDKSEVKYENARQACDFAMTTVKTTKSLIATAEDTLHQINDIQQGAFSDEKLQEIIKTLQVTSPALYNALKALTTNGLATEIASSLLPYIQTQKAELARQEKELETKQKQLDDTRVILDEKKEELQQATIDSGNALLSLQAAEKALNEISSHLSSSGSDIQAGQLQIQLEKMQAETKLNELKNQVNSAPQNLALAKQQKEKAMASMDTGLKKAEAELTDAKRLYNKLDTLTWNIYDRNGTPGYASYGQSVENIEALSNIFPIFFFLLASLVCLTTLTRMIEEDRVLIGTYKALGYTSSAIISKYVIYSLSACVFGSIIGISFAIFLFPFAINKAYSIMYTMPDLIYLFPWKQCGISFLISLACTTVVTIVAIGKELRQTPAVLMRPKAPKAGKRILLERIPAIWHRMNFTAKVTARNLFRNKQRFAMTLLGIAGCSALLLASLGMYNSIDAITTKQYGKNAISEYDFQLVFNNPQTSGSHSFEFTKAEEDSRIGSLMLTAMKSMTGSSERSDKELDVYVMVPEKPEKIGNYISLRTRNSKTPLTLTDDGAIITEKLAKDTKTGIGDEIIFTDSDGNAYKVTVSAIAENYTFHYIYMTENLYRTVTGEDPVYSYAIGNMASAFDNAKPEDLSNAKGLLTTDLMATDGIAAIAFTSETTESISQITDALSVVIILFFVSALILAFVVLYNLSNINIIERTREIATLKVLGFMDREVSSYIYRENVIISIFGIILGTGMGIVLHYLLITFTSIDTVMYGQSIAWYSYLIALAITIGIIVAVNLVLHKKLQKIDMVLSLKSVE